MLCFFIFFPQLDGFSAPQLVKETESLKDEINNQNTQITGLQEQKSNLEEIIANLKEQHKEYVNNLEAESEKSLKYQRDTLISEHQDMMRVCESNFHFPLNCRTNSFW